MKKKIKARCLGVSEESKRLAYQDAVENNIYILMSSVFCLFPDETTNLKKFNPDNKKRRFSSPRHIYPVLAKAFGIPRHLRSKFEWCETPAEMAKFVAFEVWDLKKSKAKYLHTEYGYAVRG